MSNVATVLPCCCGQNPCGNPCCEDVEYGIFWSGNFLNIFNACSCLEDVPNFICPCFGQVQIGAGQVGRVRLQRVPPAFGEPCGGCSTGVDAVALSGSGSYFCPCACQWEDPPFSGQFYTCAQVAPELCGAFSFVAGIGDIERDQTTGCQVLRPGITLTLDTTPNQQFGGRWMVHVPIVHGYPIKPDCREADTAYCHFDPTGGLGSWSSRVFHPDGFGVRYDGPQVAFCPDGRVDWRSMQGTYQYAAGNIVEQGQNQNLIWSPGTVVIS